MKIITVEEHYMSEEVNNRFKELNPPKDQLEANQTAFVDMFMKQGTITDIADRRIAFMDAAGVDVQIIGYGNNHPAKTIWKDLNDEYGGMFLFSTSGRTFAVA